MNLKIIDYPVSKNPIFQKQVDIICPECDNKTPAMFELLDEDEEIYMFECLKCNKTFFINK